jgi:hypothetical protein
MTDANILYVSLEAVGSTGRQCHISAVPYTEIETVASIVPELVRTPWNYLELAYVVKRIEPDEEWKIRPSYLKWVKREKQWYKDMTMKELFDGVELEENERHYLVATRLDVKTKHYPPDQYNDRVRVENAVYWLNDLYLEVAGMTGMLRDLRGLAAPR